MVTLHFLLIIIEFYNFQWPNAKLNEERCRFHKAATDIRENKLSIRKGAEKHGIDRMTLKRYLEKVAKDGTDNATMGYSSHRKVFTAAMETDLAQHLMDLCNRFYGLTPSKSGP